MLIILSFLHVGTRTARPRETWASGGIVTVVTKLIMNNAYIYTTHFGIALSFFSSLFISHINGKIFIEAEAVMGFTQQLNRIILSVDWAQPYCKCLALQIHV